MAVQLYALFPLVEILLGVFLEQRHGFRGDDELIFIIVKLIYAVYKYKRAVFERCQLAGSFYIYENFCVKRVCVVAEREGYKVHFSALGVYFAAFKAENLSPAAYLAVVSCDLYHLFGICVYTPAVKNLRIVKVNKSVFRYIVTLAEFNRFSLRLLALFLGSRRSRWCLRLRGGGGRQGYALRFKLTVKRNAYINSETFLYYLPESVFKAAFGYF